MSSVRNNGSPLAVAKTGELMRTRSSSPRGLPKAFCRARGCTRSASRRVWPYQEHQLRV